MKLSRDVKDMAGGILIGSAFGAAGLVAGIVLAPRSGKKLRSMICRKASRVWDKVEGLV